MCIRSLSNLIDNAVEACGTEGKIDLEVTGSNDLVEVTVSDSGAGMSDEQLKSIGTRGYTSGKSNGSGLGAWYAVSAIASWGGSVTYESQVAQGTKVRITLPRASSPSCIADKVTIPADSVLIICDDDRWVHDAWDSRLAQALGPSAADRVRHCYTSEDLLNVMVPIKLRQCPFVVFCDFDLGGQWNGLELIDQLGLNTNSYLVTSHENSDLVRQKCQEAGVKLLSKGRLRDVPIEVIPSQVAKRFGGSEE
ncbi:ATP-binding protein [bacterium]|nr:ATP-binding protein [bacterium]